jgi:hypothetical protein
MATWQQIIENNDNKISTHTECHFLFSSSYKIWKTRHLRSKCHSTGHFLVEGAPIVNKKKAKHPITITLPNGKLIHSTHTCNLDNPWLPEHITEAHIVTGLAHSSLISTRNFCDAGYKAVFDMYESRVYYYNKLVLTGNRDPNTAL